MADHLFNLKLVSEVEKRPCLYNFTLPHYSRKDVTEQAWDEVGQAVNLSRSECKERWKNLRAVFVRHLKPRNSFRTVKPYYLADAMAFALPFVKTLSGASAGAGAAKRARREDSEDDVPLAGCGYDRSPCSSPASRDATLASPQPSTWKKRSLDDSTEDPATTDTDPREDYHRMFLLSLLPDVNLMTPVQVRRFKRIVLQSIDDILNDARVHVKTEPE